MADPLTYHQFERSAFMRPQPIASRSPNPS
jgi:hypothetical protein